MYGVDEDDPYCIKTVDELVVYINEVGFLPLFKNEIPGFSVEERTVPTYWWSGDEERDPWAWREVIARSGNVTYAYKEEPEVSKERVYKRIKEICPEATEKQILKVLR